MLIQLKPKKLFLLTMIWLLLVLAGWASLSGLFRNDSRKAEAATSSTINFQARLLTNTGALVPDGYYNVQFNLYSASTGGTSQWSETYYDSNGPSAGNDNRVRVVNGYLSVYLGSQTALPNTINWDQEQWLTLNIGGTAQTATPTWDGEMTPRLKLSASPYALTAGSLQATNGANALKLDLASPTANVTYTLQSAAAGSYDICTTATVCSGYAAASGSSSYIQNGTSLQTGASFNIDGTGAISTSLTTPLVQGASGLTLQSTGANTITLDSGTTGAVNIGTGANAKTITIGNTTGGSQVNIQSDTGKGTAGDINIGANSETSGYRYINIGSTGSTAGSNVVNIATSNNTSYSQAVTIGTNTTGNSTVVVQGGTTGSVSLQVGAGGTVNVGTTTDNVLNLGTGVVTNTIKVGGTSMTGTLTLGQSTANNTINIGSAAGNTKTQTINIGTSSTTGSTTNVTLGSTKGGTTTIQGGTVQQTVTGGSVTIQSVTTNSTAAFQVQNSGGSNLIVADTSNSRVGINTGALSLATNLNVYNSGESTTQTDLTQNMTNAGINLMTDYVQDAYTAGLFWSTQNNSPTSPKAGIYTQLTNSGSKLLFGTSSSYAAGLTNTALTLGYNGDAVFRNGTNTSTGFQVQNSIGTGLFTVNTSTGATLTSTLYVDTLGPGSTTAVCWDSVTLQITSCASTGSIGFWNRTGTTLSPSTAGDSLQLDNNTSILFKDSGGSARTVLGVTAANNVQLMNGASSGSLQLENKNNTGGILFYTGSSVNQVASLNATGQALFQNSTDSPTAFQIQNTSNDSILNVDTTGSGEVKVGGVNGYSTAIDDNGIYFSRPSANYIQATDANGYLYFGVGPTNNQNFIISPGGESTFKPGTDSNTAFQVQNAGGAVALDVDTNAGTNAILNVGGSGYTDSQITFRRGATETYTIGSNAASPGGSNGLFVYNETSGKYVMSLDGSTGAAIFKNGTNSTTAFQIQKSDSTPLFTADTSNMRIQIGSSGTPTSQLFVSGSAPAAATGSVTASTSGLQDISVQGNYAYTIDYSNSLFKVVDVSNPASMSVIGSVSTNSRPQALAVVGNYAYVADDTGQSLDVIDISNPASPVMVSNIGLGHGAFSVAVSGRYAYVGVVSGLIRVIDIANPLNPTLASTFSATGNPASIAVAGNYLYYADTAASGTFYTVNISNSASLSAAGSVSIGGQSACAAGGILDDQTVFVQGRYAYVTVCSTNTVKIFDISNPASPTAVGSGISTGASTGPLGVNIQGRYAYVTLYNSNQFGIYDISNPASPSLIGTTSNGASSGPMSMAIQGRYAYVADWLDNKINSYNLGGSYIQQFESGSIQTSHLSVNGNSSFSGDINIQGGINLSGNAAINGTLGVSGPVVFQNSTNSTTAFQIQDSSVGSVLNVDTTNKITTLTAGIDGGILGTSLFTGSFSGTGWTTSGTGVSATATHTTGTTAVGPSPAVAISSGNRYFVQWTITNPNAGSTLNITMGGQTLATYSFDNLTGGTYSFTDSNTIISSSSANLQFIPSSSFTGEVSAVTVQLMTYNSSPGLVLNNTTGGASAEIRASSNQSNLFVGYNAGTQNVSGGGNTALGSWALQYNVSGSRNTALGTGSLETNSNGDDNVALGYNALQANTSGFSNVAIGSGALQSNTWGGTNIAIGDSALSTTTGGYDNIAIGHGALQDVTSNYGLVAIGSGAGGSLTTGGGNTAVGYGTLRDDVTGYNNTALGQFALDHVTGNENVGVGLGTLQYTTTGAQNTVVGTYALNGNSAGNANTIFGYSAGNNLTSGDANILIGYQAGFNLTSGTGNIIIGSQNAPNATGSNQLDIGDAIYGDLSTGSIKLQNSTNSTSAFQILQATTNANLLNVDSTNSNITLLGNNTGEIQAWQTNANAPGGFIAKSVILNGYIYSISDGVSDQNVSYAKINSDGSTGVWTSTTSTPTADIINAPGVVAAGGYIYFIGGQDNSTSTTLTSTYSAKQNPDGSLGAWTSLSSTLPAGVWDAGTTVANGYIYVVGGYNGGSQRNVYYAKYNADGTLGSWTTQTNALPASQSANGLVAVNGWLYSVAGYTGTSGSGGNSTATVYKSQLNQSTGATGTWASTSAIPAATQNPRAVTQNGYVYAIGGNIDTGFWNGSGEVSTVYYAKINNDGTLGTWQTSAHPMTNTATTTGVANANGYIYNIDLISTGDHVYYTSGTRLQVGGSLDLVGIQGGNLNDGGAGGSLTAGNTNIVGTLAVQGQATFANSINVGGNLSVGSKVLFQNASDSTTAFQIQNTSGTSLFTADTSGSNITIDSSATLKVQNIDSSGTVGTITRVNRVAAASATTYGTGSYTPGGTFTPGPNHVLLAYVHFEPQNQAMAADGSDITISGGSLTWVPVTGKFIRNNGWGDGFRVFYAVTSSSPPSNMQVTVDAGSVSMNKYEVTVDEMSGVDTVTPVVGAVTGTRQSNSSDTWTATLGATPTTSDWKILLGVMDQDNATHAWSAAAGWTEYSSPASLRPSPDATAMYQTGTTSTTLSYSLGSVQYSNADTAYGGFILKVGTGSSISIGTGTASGIIIGNSTSQLTVSGTSLFKNNVSNSTTALQVQNTSGSAILDVDTQNGRVGVGAGNNAPTRTLDSNGTLGGGGDVESFTDSSATTHTVSTGATAYYVSTSSGTTATTFNSTVNITGLPATDGTFAFFTVVATKGATGTSVAHSTILQVGGTTFSTVTTATTTGTSTITHSFTLARINGTWRVVGSGLGSAVAATSNTATTADFAEWLHYSGDTQPKPGDVLTIGDDPVSAKSSDSPYDTRILGVVSTSPYEVGGQDDGHSVILALTGRVPVNVSLENGPIQAGDPLTSSSVAGVAMKATKPGKIIGYALENYDGTQLDSQIIVQLQVGYNNPSNGTASQLQGNQSIDGDLFIQGSIQAENITITGIASVNSLVVSGDSTLQGNLTVSGDSTLQGNLNANQNLNVNGKTGLGNDLSVNGSTIVSGSLKVNGNSQLQEVTASSIALTGNATLNILTANVATIDQLNSTNATITNLDVNGTATIATLHITGNSIFDGLLTINSHIITGKPDAQAKLTTEVLDAAGKDINGNKDATCEIDGNDTSGTITLTTGTQDTANGAVCKITFIQSFTSAPRTIISALDKDSLQIGGFTSASNTDFTLNFVNVPDAHHVYKFNYWNPQ